MDVIHQGIVTLLRCAVEQVSRPLPDGFDLASAYPYVKSHQIVSMIYDGALRCGLPQQSPDMIRLFQSYCKALQISARQQKEIERVCNAFEAKGIDYMPLKGSIMKNLYPNPVLRMMGDADILIRTEQYPQAAAELKTLGFQEGEETSHDWGWLSNSLHLELHKYLLPPDQKEFYSYFDDGWNFAQRKTGSCHSMNAEDSFIYIFAHFAKHYRGSGIGCRHMVDLWVYLRAYPDLNEAVVKEGLEKLHLWSFYCNIRRTLAAWFEDGNHDVMTEHITEVIFASGCWGNLQNATISEVLRNQGDAQSNLLTRIRFMMRHLFPSLADMRLLYPVLKRAPWLLPVTWLQRLVRKLRSADVVRQQVKNLTDITDENVVLRKKMLNYVGLDFDWDRDRGA